MNVLVFDILATRKPRTHDIGGRPVVFQPGEAQTIPFEHAQRLLAAPEGFLVMTMEGRKLVAKDEKAFGGTTARLRSDQTIATYDELTQHALLKRAEGLAGAETFHGKTARRDLIEFLLTVGAGETPISSSEGSSDRDRDLDPDGSGPIDLT